MKTPDSRTDPAAVLLETYTAKEASQLLACSVATVIKWCTDGTFPNAKKVPESAKRGTWSISSEDLSAVVVSKGIVLDLSSAGLTKARRTKQPSVALVEALRDNAELQGQVGEKDGRLRYLEEWADKLGRENTKLKEDLIRSESFCEGLRSKLQASQRDYAGLRQQQVNQLGILEKSSEETDKKRITLEETLAGVTTTLTDVLSERSRYISSLEQERDRLVQEVRRLEVVSATLRRQRPWRMRRN